LANLAHGGGGRGNVLHHVKSDCPGKGNVQGNMSGWNISKEEMSGSRFLSVIMRFHAPIVQTRMKTKIYLNILAAKT